MVLPAQEGRIGSSRTKVTTDVFARPLDVNRKVTSTLATWQCRWVGKRKGEGEAPFIGCSRQLHQEIQE